MQLFKGSCFVSFFWQLRNMFFQTWGPWQRMGIAWGREMPQGRATHRGRKQSRPATQGCLRRQLGGNCPGQRCPGTDPPTVASTPEFVQSRPRPGSKKFTKNQLFSKAAPHCNGPEALATRHKVGRHHTHRFSEY